MNEKLLSEIAVEVNTFIDHLDIDIFNLIPREIILFYEKHASKTYTFNYHEGKPLKNQPYRDETKGIIAKLYMDYICSTSEKKEYESRIRKYWNEAESEKIARFNPDEIFVKRTVNNQQSLVVPSKKESFIKKIILKIKSKFKRTK